MDLNLLVMKINNLDIDYETKLKIVTKYFFNKNEKYFVYNYLESRKRLLMRIVQNKLDNKEVIQNNNKTIINETINNDTKVEYNSCKYFKKIGILSFNNYKDDYELTSTLYDRNKFQKKILLKHF